MRRHVLFYLGIGLVAAVVIGALILFTGSVPG
jgi:hypothetical protein